ncbi:MAG: glycoside hydrolase family 16 protein [Chitinophagales bacterium]
MNRSCFYYFLIFFLTLPEVENAQTPGIDQNWQPFFTEEFNGPINWSIWKIPDWNWQPQREIWTANNVLTNIQSGYVYFKANVNSGNGSLYDVGGLMSQNNSWPYGYYEIKWQLPSDYGRWLSFWIWGGNTTPDGSEEIDMFENHAVNNNDWYMNTHIHLPTSCNPGNGFHAVLPTDLTIGDNIIGIEWTPKVLIFYLNNVPVKEIFYDGCIPFTRKSIMFITPGIASNQNPSFLPNYTKVDYVKVYTLKKNLIDVSITNNTQLTSYLYEVKRNIEFNGQTSPLSVASGTQPTFRATQGIIITGDFTVPLGSGITLFTHDEPNN